MSRRPWVGGGLLATVVSVERRLAGVAAREDDARDSPGPPGRAAPAMLFPSDVPLRGEFLPDGSFVPPRSGGCP